MRVTPVQHIGKIHTLHHDRRVARARLELALQGPGQNDIRLSRTLGSLVGCVEAWHCRGF